MKNINLLQVFASLLFFYLVGPTAASTTSDYKINAGDVLSISVWKETELNREVIVAPDGDISFPLVGHLTAAGSRVEELQKAIAERLTRYIPDPVVTVSLVQIGGNRVFVIGKVNKPGVYPMSQNIDVMQALTMAGGLTPYAATGSIKVLRRDGEEQKIFPFDYSDVEDGEQLEQNRNLKSGDIVIVP